MTLKSTPTRNSYIFCGNLNLTSQTPLRTAVCLVQINLVFDTNGVSVRLFWQFFGETLRIDVRV